MKRGRKQTVGLQVMQSAKFNSTVADIVQSTGAKPNTVRAVLRRAATKGEIHIQRFYKGHSGLAMKVIPHDEGVESRLNGLIFGFYGKVTK